MLFNTLRFSMQAFILTRHSAAVWHPPPPPNDWDFSVHTAALVRWVEMNKLKLDPEELQADL